MGTLTGDLAGLDPLFFADLSRAAAAAPGAVQVTSGYRTYAEQAALKKLKPKLAAAPGKSRHEKGQAADLAGSGLSWLHAHAAEFSLRFPMSYEPWHIEPTTKTGTGPDPAAAAGAATPSDPAASGGPIVKSGTARRVGKFTAGAAGLIIGVGLLNKDLI